MRLLAGRVPQNTNTFTYANSIDPKWADPASDPVELANIIMAEKGVPPERISVYWVETIRKQMSFKGKVAIFHHCTLSGVSRTDAREVRIDPPDREAQYDDVVTIRYTEPRKRRGRYFSVDPTNIVFVTVEVGGRLVYDSRTEVPLDMAFWNEKRAE